MSDSPRSADDWFEVLANKAREFDGQPPFSDQALVDFRTGTRELISIDEVAAALVAPSTSSGTVTVEAEFVVDPDARGRGLGTRLLETLLSRSPRGLLVWAHGDHPAARALAASHDLIAVRELLHLGRRVEPVGASATNYSAGEASTSSILPEHSTHLDTFRVGRDEDAWVALNALIFATHAEQGSVTRADLEQLEAERWFNADDFLVLRDGDGDTMIGYCWLKVEGDRGEFYVVGVHPDRQGEKLGARLFDAGLARMRERGIHEAHLYVEGDNAAALQLYRSRGFEQDSIDVQYSSAR